MGTVGNLLTTIGTLPAAYAFALLALCVVLFFVYKVILTKPQNGEKLLLKEREAMRQEELLMAVKDTLQELKLTIDFNTKIMDRVLDVMSKCNHHISA